MQACAMLLRIISPHYILSIFGGMLSCFRLNISSTVDFFHGKCSFTKAHTLISALFRIFAGLKQRIDLAKLHIDFTTSWLS